jgi:hypothetical protein
MIAHSPFTVSHVTVPIGGLGQSAVTLHVGVQTFEVPIGVDAHLQPLADIGQAVTQSESSVHTCGPIIPSGGGGIIPSGGGGIIPSGGGGIIPSYLQASDPVAVHCSPRSGCATSSDEQWMPSPTMKTSTAGKPMR